MTPARASEPRYTDVVPVGGAYPEGNLNLEVERGSFSRIESSVIRSSRVAGSAKSAPPATMPALGVFSTTRGRLQESSPRACCRVVGTISEQVAGSSNVAGIARIRAVL